MHLHKVEGWGEPFILLGACHHLTHEIDAFRRHCVYHQTSTTRVHISTSKCSTPFGVIAVITTIDKMPIGSIKCAQRLSASLRLSHQRIQIRCQPDLVLNAFRRHCGYHRDRLGDHAASRSRCSTPFGVTAVITTGRRQRPECSTPFGVTAVINRDRRASGRARSGAQRLSASLRLSPLVSGTVEPDRSECSTPFGVTAVITSWRSASKALHMVCSTPFGVTAVITIRSISRASK